MAGPRTDDPVLDYQTEYCALQLLHDAIAQEADVLRDQLVSMSQHCP